MSDDAKPKKKKGMGMKMILLLVVGILLGGVGAAGGLYATGFFGKEAEGPKVDPNKPVLVLAGESAEDIAKAHSAAHGGAGAHASAGHGKGIDLPAPSNPSAYQATYFQLQQPFTSNMSDTDAFAQISLAVSTYYDLRVIDAVKIHEMAIRSQVLMMLAEQPQQMLDTPQGKQQLQKKIRTIINEVLKQKSGYGGIDNVYFTSFVIQ